MAENYEQLWHNGQLLGELTEKVKNEVNFDKFGVASATLHYQCFFDLAPQLISNLLYHPVFPWLVRHTAKISREEAGYATVVINFRGVPLEETQPNNNTFKKTYSLEGATSQEPIETHPRFSEFAGDPEDKTTWENGATFTEQKVTDKEGEDTGKVSYKFNGFSPSLQDGSANPFAGVKSYLEPSFVYTETETLAKADIEDITLNMNQLGETSTPPSSNILPVVKEPRDWILVSASVEEVGEGVKITRKWKLSGRNGWLQPVYNPEWMAGEEEP